MVIRTDLTSLRLYGAAFGNDVGEDLVEGVFGGCCFCVGAGGFDVALGCGDGGVAEEVAQCVDVDIGVG